MSITNTYNEASILGNKKPTKPTRSIVYRNDVFSIKETPPQPSKYRDLQAFFIVNGATTQQFKIEVDRPILIKTNHGMVIALAAHSFVNMVHQPVIGKIIIRIKEIFSKSEMVLSNKPSTTQHRLLTSGGTFYISATQRNLPLQLVRPAEVHLPIAPQITTPNIFRVFRGRRMIDFSISKKPYFDWQNTVLNSIKVGMFKKQKVFHLTLKELGWFNCNHFYQSNAPRTTCRIAIQGIEKKLKEQVCFIILKKANVVARLLPKEAIFFLPKMPSQEEVTMVSIGIDEDQQLYFGKQELEQLTASSIPLMMLPIDESLLLKICQNLG